MRRLPLCLSLATFACIACDPSDPPPPPPAEQVCCDDGLTRALQKECGTGQVALPASACVAPTDAGVVARCGDGRFDQGLEACDTSTSAGNVCGAGKACSNCQCVVAVVCGDGQVGSGEDCENNTHCTVAGTVCRACRCRRRSEPVEFRDREGDVPVTSTRFADITSVAFTIDGPPTERIDVNLAGRPAARSSFGLCLHLVEGVVQVGQLCGSIDSLGNPDLRWFEVGGNDHSILNQGSSFGTTASGVRITIHDSVGVRFDAGDDFYWTTTSSGAAADRLPDEGLLPMSDVVGLP